MKKFCLIIILLYCTFFLQGALRVRIFGYVLDENNRGMSEVNVLQKGTNNGTISNRNGYYELWVDMPDTVTVVYSMVGYETIEQQLFTPMQVLGVNVVMQSSSELLDEITIRGWRRQTEMMDRVEGSVARLMPDASGGNIESLLITFAGVTQRNEMSSQYNVRGGSFDENSVYVNGIAIQRPLLIRAGHQEGLSFANPKMVENIKFSAGGFTSQYGDKSSSVLDITYKHPTHFEASVDASLLGANVYIGHGNKKVDGMYSLRYKTSQYVLNSLDQVGNYFPQFLDFQSQLSFLLFERERKRWSLQFLTNVSRNSYRFLPDSISNSFGTMYDVYNLTIYYEGQEKDLFRNAFGALSLKGKIGPSVELNFDLSGYYSTEKETYDITGEYLLQEQYGTDVGTIGREDDGEIGNVNNGAILGVGTYHEHARNTLNTANICLATNGTWRFFESKMLWGVSLQSEWIKDNISEWEWRDSTGFSLPRSNTSTELFYTMKGHTNLQTWRLQGFIEDSYEWHTKHGDVKLTSGMRFHWWTYNAELLSSPRINLTWTPTWKKDVCFRLGTGFYFQAPYYKELRDTLIDQNRITRIKMNKNIRAPRNYHIVLANDYYFRIWGRPFKMTTELYGKIMDRGISYTVENVKVRYSGENDIKGYTIGIDFKFFGELVPGVDSWICFSTMRSREHFINDTYHLGWRPTPQEQRYNFSMLFQDYLPQLPQLKAQIRFIISDGLPYGAPHSILTRNTARMTNYKRLDLGFMHTCDANAYNFMKKSKFVKAWTVGIDIFNLVDFKNVNSYFWVSDAYGRQWASPNYLSGRRWNLKLSVDF